MVQTALSGSALLEVALLYTAVLSIVADCLYGSAQLDFNVLGPILFDID